MELDVLPDNIFLVSDEEGHHKFDITGLRRPKLVEKWCAA
jgi:hypothetical protein